MAYLAVKTGRRFLVTILGCLAPFAGVIILYVLPRSNIGGSLAGLYMVFFYWGPYTNTAGELRFNRWQGRSLEHFSSAEVSSCGFDFH